MNRQVYDINCTSFINARLRVAKGDRGRLSELVKLTQEGIGENSCGSRKGLGRLGRLPSRS
jgi:hypothetical protein